ncbi:MAG: UvrD-helicase domain-containing protein, partial [Rhodothermales bacterium]
MSSPANDEDRRPERQLRDQEARDTITRDLDRNIMVLAGAGAGKTHALIERMVASIREAVCDVDRMAAITFTRKAAGEMRGRFFLRLRKEARSAGTEDEVARIRSALTDIDQCFIGTIHSFCGRLLRERPIEAGLAPDFTEIDDRDEAALRRAVWD